MFSISKELGITAKEPRVLSLATKDPFLEMVKEKLHEIQELCYKKAQQVNSVNFPDRQSYFIEVFKINLSSILNLPTNEIQIDLANREKTGGADLAVTFPHLIKCDRSKHITQELPEFVRKIKESELANSGIVASVTQARGIYVNLTLSLKTLLGSVFQAATDKSYGLSNSLLDRKIVVDYSSPNVAKKLHAGHIRSTIIGHILSNVYESQAASVFRVNHINDWGGFGFLILADNNWGSKHFKDLDKNEKLAAFYRVRRLLEKVVNDNQPLTDTEKDEADSLLGSNSQNTRKSKAQEFIDKSEIAFKELEFGNKEYVEAWKKMVGWSLEDFNGFYNLLGVSLDICIGESFYTAFLDEFSSQFKDSIIKYTQAEADNDIEVLRKQLEEGQVKQQEYDTLLKGIVKDINASVIRISPQQRLVFLASDGHSIYQTRDLIAVFKRLELFKPTDIVYVTGQEQQQHFSDIFQVSSNLLNLEDKLKLHHIWFGFYIDADSKDKLSTRQGASSVETLLKEAIRYFKDKFHSKTTHINLDYDEISRQVAVGSIIFNDIIKSSGSTVELHTDDLTKNFKTFEKSGGAYIMYTACRANKVVKSSNVSQLSLDSTDENYNLMNKEIGLIKLILNFPSVLEVAAKTDSPHVLAQYLLSLAKSFNSFYSDDDLKIIGDLHEMERLIITSAVNNILRRGLAICNINCPELI